MRGEGRREKVHGAGERTRSENFECFCGSNSSDCSECGGATAQDKKRNAAPARRTSLDSGPGLNYI